MSTTATLNNFTLDTEGYVQADHVVELLVGFGHQRDDVLAVIDSLIEASGVDVWDESETSRYFDDSDIDVLIDQLTAA